MSDIPVYDIETLGWTEPIAVGFYDGRDYHEFLKVSEDHDVIWEFLCYLEEHYRGIKLYAHNAAHFDNKFLLHALYSRKQKVLFPSGLARLTWDETGIDFEDSYLVVSRNLDSFCKAFNVPQKLSWDHNETKNIWEMQSSLDEFRAYLKRDCISLSKAMGEYVQTLLREFNVLPSMTMPLTSAKIFDKCFFPVKKIASNEDVERQVRLATYGGRNEVYSRKGKGVYFYDIRSMYTSCYDVPVPVGKLRWTSPNVDKPSLAEAIAKIPNRMVGPLPYRYRIPGTNEVRLTFPVGTIKGWWDTRELSNAAYNHGVDLKILRQLRADEEPVLKEFGERICELRDASNKELARIWKLHGVRLSGKMGQHRVGTEVKHITEIEDLTGWYPLDDREVYHEKVVIREGSRSPYIKPAVNMRIRAEARLRHMKWLIEAKDRGNLFYCNNDSVVTDVPLYTGKKPGDLQLLDYATEAFFVRCNFYGYEDSMGNLKQKTSGYHDFKLIKRDFEKLLNGGKKKNNFESVSSWKQSLTEDGVKMVPRRRTIAIGRNFENRIIDGYETRPLKLDLVNGEVVTLDPPNKKYYLT